MKPYFYKIKEKQTGKIYVGCQYGVKSNPSNFWVTYFTSNKYVKSQPKESFDVVLVKERHDAREYEKRYLQKCYRLLGRERFIELLINRNIAPGILNTPETIAKANSPSKKFKNSLAAKKRIEQGTHNFLVNKYEHSEEWKAKIRNRMLGENNPSKNPEITKKRITEEFRKKQAEGSKGNKNVRGKSWWNNGIERKRNEQSPGEGWIKGYRFETTEKKE
jgi:hypothetical protein